MIYEGSVTGRICDPSGGLWIVGATVTLSADLNGDGTIDVEITTTTDADGYYTLTGVPDGTWLVRVEKGSFSVEFEVTVAGATPRPPKRSASPLKTSRSPWSPGRMTPSRSCSTSSAWTTTSSKVSWATRPRTSSKTARGWPSTTSSSSTAASPRAGSATRPPSPRTSPPTPKTAARSTPRTGRTTSSRPRTPTP
ncbi:MAG: carboxypeptidase regulatory-like domain-containing protein [Deltaproteobacteria bacterium]|nr:carboxypeptidase regulatory-like domain-containing protein [Deltaproteobacteria bacterium]